MNRIRVLASVAALTVAGLAGAQLANGAGDADPSAFVPTVPCRLFDTRPSDKVGDLTTLTAATTQTANVWGTNGECTIPSTATAVAMNVTTVGGSAPSFLTIWPSDATSRPATSNLNWLPGAAPTPNKVDVKLAANGKISLYSPNGTVDVIADVVGYYEPVVSAKGTISAVTVVTQQITVAVNGAGTGSVGSAIAQCPTGMVAIGGGVEGPTSVALNTRSTRPEPAVGNPTGWFGDVRSSSPQPGNDGVTATVYAVCITLNL